MGGRDTLISNTGSFTLCQYLTGDLSNPLHIMCYVKCEYMCETKAHVAVDALVVVPTSPCALAAHDVFLKFITVPVALLGAAAYNTVVWRMRPYFGL